MNPKTLREIKSKRSEFESAVEVQNHVIARFKKRLKVGKTLAILTSAAIFIWGALFGGSYLGDIAVSSAVAVGFAATVAGAGAALAVAIAADAIAFAFVIVFAIAFAFVIAFGVGAVGGSAIGLFAFGVSFGFAAMGSAEYFLGKNEKKLWKLEQKLRRLTEISPDDTPDACNYFAELVDQGEPLAIDLYKKLKDLGRRPTLGEIEGLDSEIKKKSKPSLPVEQAKESCERLFGH